MSSISFNVVYYCSYLERRGNYVDDGGVMDGSYDRPPVPPAGGYGDRRPLMDMGAWDAAPKSGGFDRGAPPNGNDMFSRRSESGPKPLMANSYDGSVAPAGGYGAPSTVGYNTSEGEFIFLLF